jgi:hypothetical protein
MTLNADAREPDDIPGDHRIATLSRIRFLRRGLMTAGSSARDLSRLLKIRLPQDLGWELQSLASRGVRIVFLFARGDVGMDLLRMQGGAALKSIGDRCRVHVINGADHIFSQGAARDELLQLLTSELPR